MTYTELLEEWARYEREHHGLVDFKLFPLLPGEREALFAEYGTQERVVEAMAEGICEMLTGPSHELTEEELRAL